MASFSPRKKFRGAQSHDFPLEGRVPPPMFAGNPHGYNTGPLCCFPNSTPAGIQGARHAQFGISLPDLHISKLQSGLYHTGFRHPDHTSSLSRHPTGLIVDSLLIDNNLSCLLTVGNNSKGITGSSNRKPPQLVLFGKPILTEEQISLSNSGVTGNSSSEGNLQKNPTLSDGSGSAINNAAVFDSASVDGLQWFRDHASELGLETGPCKVFMESDDVGRTLDLSTFGSYDELHGRLADMFGTEKSEMTSHVIYKDAAGAVKHTGDEPFSDFMKTARRLTILTDSASDNLGRLPLLGPLIANLQCCS